MVLVGKTSRHCGAEVRVSVALRISPTVMRVVVVAKYNSSTLAGGGRVKSARKLSRDTVAVTSRDSSYSV